MSNIIEYSVTCPTKKLWPMLLNVIRRRRTAISVALRTRARQCSNKSSSPPSTAENARSNQVSSIRSANPGTVRVRRGNDPRAEEIEMDTTITRIMGSDWGDRSKQPVSYAMKLYWGIFLVVLANGAYTYFAGKDGMWCLYFNCCLCV